MELALLAQKLKQSLGIVHKQDIQTVARFLATENAPSDILLGDDCAAIPDGDGYLLLATEGMMPDFVSSDPWFAGWSAVMVNVSDIYAMGGRPIAVVDTLWSQDAAISQSLLAGMSAAARAYGVPIVGGHTNGRSEYNALSVAILGRAQRLISSFTAQPGDRLVMAIDLRGKSHPKYPFWNAATETDPIRLCADLELLPKLAENGLCAAGKDISMGGIIGTTLMLLETSKCGAVLDLDAIPRPPEIPVDRWLVSFPSYGFLLSVHPKNVPIVRQMFRDRQITCEDIGEVSDSPQLILKSQQESTVFWDFDREHLTGFG
ncbi:sll0787 family AIR synthase-like protein [Chamaesiphon sp. OTE_20_metabat_361]|uniref:sll0787 family AIR synthase-like protein n=1 Tax=Chamaesiphon sp. OTE_20_metabat_361 TaxID=2964689 RepID=UPI00286A441F|nr:sll0787 family AIR synthase-like protein [Chamaesiphon sp. OTE_20_metabat_361]